MEKTADNSILGLFAAAAFLTAVGGFYVYAARNTLPVSGIQAASVAPIHITPLVIPAATNPVADAGYMIGELFIPPVSATPYHSIADIRQAIEEGDFTVYGRKTRDTALDKKVGQVTLPVAQHQ